MSASQNADVVAGAAAGNATMTASTIASNPTLRQDYVAILQAQAQRRLATGASAVAALTPSPLQQFGAVAQVAQRHQLYQLLQQERTQQVMAQSITCESGSSAPASGSGSGPTPTYGGVLYPPGFLQHSIMAATQAGTSVGGNTALPVHGTALSGTVRPTLPGSASAGVAGLGLCSLKPLPVAGSGGPRSAPPTAQVLRGRPRSSVRFATDVQQQQQQQQHPQQAALEPTQLRRTREPSLRPQLGPEAAEPTPLLRRETSSSYIDPEAEGVRQPRSSDAYRRPSRGAGVRTGTRARQVRAPRAPRARSRAQAGRGRTRRGPETDSSGGDGGHDVEVQGNMEGGVYDVDVEYNGAEDDGDGSGRGPAGQGRWPSPTDADTRSDPERFPLSQWSITVSARRGNVPGSWFDEFKTFMETLGVHGGAVALEMGRNESKLHLQAVMRLHWPTTDEWANHLKKLLRGALLGANVPGASIMSVSPFKREQRWGPMLGYVQKDRKQPHYKIRAVNVTQEELNSGVREWEAVSTYYERAGKKKLYRKDFASEARAFYHKHLAPVRVPMEQVLWYMVTNGDYEPDSSWVTPPQGRGATHVQCAAWWNAVLRPEEWTLIEAFDLFYGGGSNYDVHAEMAKAGYRLLEPTAEDAHELLSGYVRGKNGLLRHEKEVCDSRGQPVRTFADVRAIVLAARSGGLHTAEHLAAAAVESDGSGENLSVDAREALRAAWGNGSTVDVRMAEERWWEDAVEFAVVPPDTRGAEDVYLRGENAQVLIRIVPEHEAMLHVQGFYTTNGRGPDTDFYFSSESDEDIT